MFPTAIGVAVAHDEFATLSRRLGSAVEPRGAVENQIVRFAMRIPLNNPAVARKDNWSGRAAQHLNQNLGRLPQSLLETSSKQSGIRPQACRYICYPKLDGGFECSVSCTF